MGVGAGRGFVSVPAASFSRHLLGQHTPSALDGSCQCGNCGNVVLHWLEPGCHAFIAGSNFHAASFNCLCNIIVHSLVMCLVMGRGRGGAGWVGGAYAAACLPPLLQGHVPAFGGLFASCASALAR